MVEFASSTDLSAPPGGDMYILSGRGYSDDALSIWIKVCLGSRIPEWGLDRLRLNLTGPGAEPRLPGRQQVFLCYLFVCFVGLLFLFSTLLLGFWFHIFLFLSVFVFTFCFIFLCFICYFYVLYFSILIFISFCFYVYSPVGSSSDIFTYF